MQQTLVSKKQATQTLARPTPLNRRTLWAAIALVAVLWAVSQARVFGRDIVNEGGWPLTWQFIQSSLRPDLSPELLRTAINAAVTTLAYAVCGTALSLSLGFVGGLLGTEVWWQAVVGGPAYRWPWLSIRAALVLPRAIHEIIWGLFFINLLGLDPLVAILAIALPYGAITAKVFAEIMDATPREPFLALLNSGVSPLPAFLYGLLPQALSNLLSYTFYRLECALRSAAVLGAIGAGGLGYQILLSGQSLRYEQMWTFLYFLIALSGLTDLWSSAVRRHLGQPVVAGDGGSSPANAAPDAPCAPPRRQNALATTSLAVVIAGAPLAFWYVRADFTRLFSPRTAKLFSQVWQQSLPPAHDPIFLSQVWAATVQTFALSILAIAIASLGGASLSFLAARNFAAPANAARSRRWMGHGLFIIARAILLLCRAIPASIWALILLFVLFPGVLPGAVALGLYTLGVLGRLMAETAENLDDRAARALQALGATGPQTFFYSALPRALPNYIAYILYRWEVSARETVIVGVVGAAGLGRLLAEQLSNFNYPAVLTLLIAFILLTSIVDLISAAARRALR